MKEINLFLLVIAVMGYKGCKEHNRPFNLKHFSVLVFILFVVGCASRSKATTAATNISNQNMSIANKMKITIGNGTFIVTLYDNTTATAFKGLLPMTIHMAELNGNEKHVDLPKSLPPNPANPGTIQNGDVMLYGSSTLVLFYKTFNTSYNYTRLGKIENVEGLASSLGPGNVEVTFELEH